MREGACPGLKVSCPLSGTIVPFLKAVYRYRTFLDADFDAKNKDYIFSLGLDVFLNDHVSLQPAVSYTMGKSEGMSAEGTTWIDVSTISAGIGIAVFVGN